jgi:TonB family protein
MSFALPVPLLVAAVSTADSGGRRDEFYDPRGIGLLPATTLVIWVCCLVVGIIGMIWPGGSSSTPTTQQAMPIEAVEVEVTNHAPAQAAPPPPPQVSPQIVQLSPQAPPLIPALFADPLMPLAQPAQMPLRAVNTAVPLGAMAVKTITFGVGEGRQPMPEYPEEARYAGEEGTVTIVFNVDKDGDVTSATTDTPCRWPILNGAALRAVRQTWHFGPGPPRAYIVVIRYELIRR